MTNKNSNVIIENGKVIFSQEILDYFKNLRNEETSEWIDKYFEILSDLSNIDSEKFNIHHIRPCCTFKDETHKTRKETQKLADKFNGNIIKLSIYNHLFAHYYLWKIFNNKNSKIAFQFMCGQKQIDNLTENELKEIARLKEECVKENQTDKERKEKMKIYYKNNKEKISKQIAEHKEEKAKQQKIYRENNKEKIKGYYKNNKEKALKESKEQYNKNKEKILQQRKERYKRNKEKEAERYKNNKEKIAERNSQKCIDPINKTKCTYCALQIRKNRNKEKYKDVKLSECIIKINN